eukprot:GHVO01011877.1.p1 GENE.GHVO01011877.1~~GHVO01011877.1.p1  ORF type:complete len:120 (-),score=3.17 GHVO01011877.1:293-652(-)
MGEYILYSLYNHAPGDNEYANYDKATAIQYDNNYTGLRTRLCIMCFIDYSKAFDCVNHSLLWTDMRRMGFPEHVVEMLAHLYQDHHAAVRTCNGTSDTFPVGGGVRQGCILSPSLFNIY